MDTSSGKIAHALRTRASLFTEFADILGDRDAGNSAVLREDAAMLRCQAAVIEDLAAMYDQLGQEAQWWGEFVQRLRKVT